MSLGAPDTRCQRSRVAEPPVITPEHTQIEALLCVLTRDLVSCNGTWHVARGTWPDEQYSHFIETFRLITTSNRFTN
jgi:hypothetical protein